MAGDRASTGRVKEAQTLAKRARSLYRWYRGGNYRHCSRGDACDYYTMGSPAFDQFIGQLLLQLRLNQLETGV